MYFWMGKIYLSKFEKKAFSFLLKQLFPFFGFVVWKKWQKSPSDRNWFFLEIGRKWVWKKSRIFCWFQTWLHVFDKMLQTNYWRKTSFKCKKCLGPNFWVFCFTSLGGAFCPWSIFYNFDHQHIFSIFSNLIWLISRKNIPYHNGIFVQPFDHKPEKAGSTYKKIAVLK
jgi:hypothetical protein